jgi:hypothetical protein
VDRAPHKKGRKGADDDEGKDLQDFWEKHFADRAHVEWKAGAYTRPLSGST